MLPRALSLFVVSQKPCKKLVPHIKNPKVSNLIHFLHRPYTVHGNGSTADAVRHELATGELLSKHSHLEKAITARDKLSFFLSHRELVGDEEREFIQHIRNDLQKALTEQPWDKALPGRKKL